MLSLLAAVALAASPAVLEGGGVRATLDLDGFARELGPGPIRGSYFRLGQFQLEPSRARTRVGRSLVLSILVDEVPPGVDLARLRAHVLASQEPRPAKVTETASPPGFWFTATTPMPKNLEQWHLWFHTLAGDRWVELHFSSVGLAKADAARLERLALGVIRSLRVERR